MNTIMIGGRLVEKPVFSHEAYGEKFYRFKIESDRLSDNKDTLECIIPEVLLSQLDDEVLMSGEIRTRKVFDGTKRRFEIFVFVKEILDFYSNLNTVSIEGTICKKSGLRDTPLGRIVLDSIIASNRIVGHKSDYLPCIFWGRKAIIASGLDVGMKMKLNGRLQSRKYIKKLDDGSIQERVAYEISISDFEVIGEEVEDGKSA